MSFFIHCWKLSVVQNTCASVGEKFAEVVYWMESEACGFGAGINCRVYPRSAAMCVFALAALLQLAGYHSNSAGFITCSRPEAIQSPFPSLVLNVTMLLDILTINLTNLTRGYQSQRSLAVVVWRVEISCNSQRSALTPDPRSHNKQNNKTQATIILTEVRFCDWSIANFCFEHASAQKDN